MACDTGCCGDKEVKHCPVCGDSLPSSRLGRPRKYCSTRCRDRTAVRKSRKPKPSSLPCVVCGTAIQQDPHSPSVKRICSSECRFARKRQLKGGKPRTTPCIVCGATVHQELHSPGLRAYCSQGCINQRKRAIRKSTSNRCEACGGCFESSHRRRFCSKACRYSKSAMGTDAQCERCWKAFVRKKAGQRYCSQQCAKVAKVYVCLCCQKPFKKKIYPSGNYSCQKKYCSRDCAFEARRRKLPAAQRPLEVAKRLARWFEQWGDDVYPIVSKCSKCGIATVVSQKGQDPQRPCCECSKPPRLCAGCGCGLPRSRRLCQECAAARKAEANKRERRKARLNGTRAPSLRKRCRKFGVTFTPIPRKKVFDRDKWKCQICGVKLLPKFAKIVGTTTPHPRCPTIDHIVPLSFGPSSPGHVWDNVQACCWQCNCERAAMPLDSFVAIKATRLD